VGYVVFGSSTTVYSFYPPGHLFCSHGRLSKISSCVVVLHGPQTKVNGCPLRLSQITWSWRFPRRLSPDGSRSPTGDARRFRDRTRTFCAGRQRAPDTFHRIFYDLSWARYRPSGWHATKLASASAPCTTDTSCGSHSPPSIVYLYEICSGGPTFTTPHPPTVCRCGLLHRLEQFGQKRVPSSGTDRFCRCLKRRERHSGCGGPSLPEKFQ
jgi:hypothetical protein